MANFPAIMYVYGLFLFPPYCCLSWMADFKLLKVTMATVDAIAPPPRDAPGSAARYFVLQSDRPQGDRPEGTDRAPNVKDRWFFADALLTFAFSREAAASGRRRSFGNPSWGCFATKKWFRNWEEKSQWKLASVLDSWALKLSCNFLLFPAMCPLSKCIAPLGERILLLGECIFLQFALGFKHYER